MLADEVVYPYVTMEKAVHVRKHGVTEKQVANVVDAHNYARNKAFTHFYRPLLLEPEVSPFRTSGSQSRQYHVRDCGSSVKPTQSR